MPNQTALILHFENKEATNLMHVKLYFEVRDSAK